jgi:hypothetical protein
VGKADIGTMKFDLDKSIQILERTPRVLRMWLSGLDDAWLMNNEGEKTWSPYDVLGHLIHGERTDWIARLEIVLGDGDKRFKTFDRFAQFEESKGKSIDDLLNEFEGLRKNNLDILRSKNITQSMLANTGIHPHFGNVTLEQLLSTWTAHDLGHIAQISRVMAKQYKQAVGPWVQYMRVLQA